MGCKIQAIWWTPFFNNCIEKYHLYTPLIMFICSICNEPLKGGKLDLKDRVCSTRCGHVFHFGCIHSWWKQNRCKQWVFTLLVYSSFELKTLFYHSIVQNSQIQLHKSSWVPNMSQYSPKYECLWNSPGHKTKVIRQNGANNIEENSSCENQTWTWTRSIEV